MADPFSTHGINHLSASALNSYAEDPAYWMAKYLFGLEDSNPSMWRGSAVEAGIDHWLYKRDGEAAYMAALGRFELDAMGDLDDAVERERQRIRPIMEQAMGRLSDFPEPNARQLSVEHWFDGIEVPIIGFTDYEWDGFGIDLKTTLSLPTQIRTGHARQISLYQAARGKPYRILYATPAKAEFRSLSQEEAELHVKRYAWLAHNIRRALAVFKDKQDLAQVYVPNLDHFYWKSSAAREFAANIWRLDNA